MIRVGLLFHATRSENLGVGALTSAQVALLRGLAQEIGAELSITLFNWADQGAACVEGPDLREVTLSRRRLLNPRGLLAQLAQQDVLIDIGAGDSFTDIYGPKRLRRMFWIKALAHLTGRPYVLAPQTIGPFFKPASRALARLHLGRCAAVFARDQLSVEAGQALTGRAPMLGSDLALGLPFDAPFPSAQLRVGLNVSGLMMAGGYGQARLAEDARYAETIEQVIAAFRNHPQKPELHLIPHVITPTRREEDDHFANSELARRFPDLIQAPAFKTPQAAKGYIAGMDFMMGARMHACIAALSSGVAVLPMAYSRKFRGMFGALGYGHLADLQVDAPAAVTQKAIEAFECRAQLAVQATQASRLGLQRLAPYRQMLSALLNEAGQKERRAAPLRARLS